MPRRQGAGGAFAVHAQAARLAVHDVRLEFADVVAHVVDHLDTQVPRRALQHLGKGPAHRVGDELPVGKGEVGGAGHGADVFARPWGTEGRAAQLPVGDGDAVLLRRPLHGLDGIVAHLVAQPARAGVDGDGELVLEQPQGAGHLVVVDLGDVIDFHEMVTRTDAAELRASALQGTLADVLRLGARQAAVFFRVLQVARRAVALRHRPTGTALENALQIRMRQPHRLLARPDAGRDVAKQPFGHLAHAALHVVSAQT